MKGLFFMANMSKKIITVIIAVAFFVESASLSYALRPRASSGSLNIKKAFKLVNYYKYIKEEA